MDLCWRGQRDNPGADTVVAQGGVSADSDPALGISIAQAQIAKNKYIIIICKAEIDCHHQSSYRNTPA